MTIDFYLTPHKNSFEMVHRLKYVQQVEKRKEKLLEKNTGKYLHGFGTGKDNLDDLNRTQILNSNNKWLNWTSLTLRTIHEKISLRE